MALASPLPVVFIFMSCGQVISWRSKKRSCCDEGNGAVKNRWPQSGQACLGARRATRCQCSKQARAATQKVFYQLNLFDPLTKKISKRIQQIKMTPGVSYMPATFKPFGVWSIVAKLKNGSRTEKNESFAGERVRLDPILQKLWEKYLAAEQDQIQEVTMPAPEAFIAALEQLPLASWQDWALELAKQMIIEEQNIPIRLPLYQRVLFPALLAGLQAKRPGCARLFAGFYRLLVHSPACLAQLEAPFLNEPDDHWAWERLIGYFAWDLQYAIHEVPNEVLYGREAATAEQCILLNQALEEFCVWLFCHPDVWAVSVEATQLHRR
jgi:hypothetical protein